MPYESYYVDSGKGLHKIGSGIVTAREISVSAAEVAADVERARKLKYALIDFSQTTELQVTPEIIRQVIEVNRKTAQVTPGAFVAVIAPDPLAYGISRLWQTFTEDLGWNAHVFRGRPAAIMWLRQKLGLEGTIGEACDEYPSLRIDAEPDFEV
jgi:hypothetical protein